MHSGGRNDGQFVDQMIWNLHAYLSNRKIAKTIHVGQDRVRDVIREWSRGRRIEHQMGRPKKVTPDVISQIIALSLANGGLSDQSVADAISEDMGVHIARTTVNGIRHDERFDFGPPRKCQNLNADQIMLRRQFVREWTEGEFGQLRHMPLVFSDESRFCFGGSVFTDIEFIILLPEIPNWAHQCRDFSHSRFTLWKG